MNKKNKIVIILIVSIMTLSSLLFTNLINFNNDTNLDSNSESIAFLEKKWEAKLTEKYGSDYQNVLDLNLRSVNTSEKIEQLLKSTEYNSYPEFYGGRYINDDQELVLQIVKNEDHNNYKLTTNKLYNDILSIDNNIIVEYVDNSYNTLKEIDNYIIEYFKNHKNTDISIVANSVDVYSNKVVVELENNSQLEQEKFKRNVIDSDLIIFKSGKRSYNTLNPGQGLYNGSELACSLGFRAKLNNQDGFVTAGHCVQKINVGDTYYGYGTLVKSVYEDNNSTDAAFIKTSTSVSNNLQYAAYPVTALNTGSYPQTYTVGTIIGKSGATTGGTLGKITNSSKTMYVIDHSNYTLYALPDQVMTDVKAEGGDSGGAVFTASSKLGTILGIVQGATEETHEMNFTKFINIQQSLGITKY